MQQDLRKLQKQCWHRVFAKKENREKSAPTEIIMDFCGSFCVYFVFGEDFFGHK